MCIKYLYKSYFYASISILTLENQGPRTKFYHFTDSPSAAFNLIAHCTVPVILICLTFTPILSAKDKWSCIGDHF